MPFNFKAITGSLCALGVLMVLSMFSSAPESTESTAAVEENTVVLDQYGVDQATFQFEDQAIQRNQTFSQLLTLHGVSSEVIHQIVELTEPVFDLRHLRADRDLRLYKDALTGKTKRVIYPIDPIRYLVFDLGDPLRVYEDSHPVTTAQKEAGGTITSSPYQTLQDQGANTALAVALSRIFAWQIDFYHIQRGDNFKVIYEDQQVNGESVGLNKVLAARFEHGGKTFYAFNMGEEDRNAFYDEEGNSLRLAFLKAPLEYTRISSRYTKRRFHPVQKRYKAHLGTDYAAPTGTPIYAASDGVVVAAAYTRGNGNYVKIKHNDTYTTGYLHMSRRAKGMHRGKRVKQGDIIGYVGSTGLATGPHLCYRFWQNGRQVDPLKLDLPSAAPIEASKRDAFMALRNELLPRLLPGAILPAAMAASGNRPIENVGP
ncbi:MAG TPA: peptidoglycan DD-metalloendopeptidase family protein [Rhodothermales bacterium]|nr:peptidoglycan DD-metalloendopeptidase family protein [Rhodothermales bacterium]